MRLYYPNASFSYTGKRMRTRRIRGGRYTGAMYRIAKRVSRRAIAIETEKKWFAQTESTGISISTTPIIYTCNLIAKGTQNGERVGEKICLKKIFCRFLLNAGDPTNFVRIMVVRGKFPLVASNIPSVYGWAPTQIMSIAYDKVFAIGTSGTSVLPTNLVVEVSVPIPRKKQIVTYDNAPSNSATVDNNWTIALVSDSASASHPYWQGFYKFYYTDA